MQACSKQPPIGRLPLGANLSTLGSSHHTGQDQKPPSPLPGATTGDSTHDKDHAEET